VCVCVCVCILTMVAVQTTFSSVLLLLLGLSSPLSAVFAFQVPTTYKTTSITTSLKEPRRSTQSLSYSDVALEHEKELLKSRLPPVNRSEMSELEVEFRELLEGILYTRVELESVANPRLRAILEGISASYYEPAVYRAFEVLYEDYAPLRLAGKMVYRRLRSVMEESREYKQRQIERVIKATGMSSTEAESCWSTFIRLGHSQHLPISALKTYFGPDTLQALNSDSVESVLSKLNPERKNSLSFEELVTRMFYQTHGESQSDINHEGSANLLRKVLDSDRISLAEASDFSSRLDSKHQKYNQRYDDMLMQFGEWKEFIPDGNGRRLDIVRGCFVGSENPAVVEALRIIYVDYGPLRMSGDWIFKLVSTFMGAAQRRQSARKSP